MAELSLCPMLGATRLLSKSAIFCGAIRTVGEASLRKRSRVATVAVRSLVFGVYVDERAALWIQFVHRLA